jgi:cell division protein FtsN
MAIVSAVFLFPFRKPLAPPKTPVAVAQAAAPPGDLESGGSQAAPTMPVPQPDPVIEEPKAAGYVIQVHSFRTDSLAQRALPKLERSGFTPYVRYTNSGWYAVFTGPFESLAEARKAAAGLRNRGLSTIIRHQ